MRATVSLLQRAKEDIMHDDQERELVEVLQTLDLLPPTGQVEKIMQAVETLPDANVAPAVEQILRWSIPSYAAICLLVWGCVYYQEYTSLAKQIAFLTGNAG
tara:strand:- start:5833 stop:6138 length:306 start_codon:yes stop_codon:yes gene_type:complete